MVGALNKIQSPSHPHVKSSDVIYRKSSQTHYCNSWNVVCTLQPCILSKKSHDHCSLATSLFSEALNQRDSAKCPEFTFWLLRL
jgi:hypothetical protein